MDHRQTFLSRCPDHRLPAFRMPPAFRQFSVEGAHTVPDDMADLPVEVCSLLHLGPLFFGKMDHVSGDAHDAQEGIDQGIIDPPDAVLCLQHSPDLALGRQNHPVQRRRDDRDLLAFMRV